MGELMTDDEILAELFSGPARETHAWCLHAAHAEIEWMRKCEGYLFSASRDEARVVAHYWLNKAREKRALIRRLP
jgi:hypothetical protein